MANPAPSPDPLEQRVASLAEIVNRLIGVVSRLDDETSDTRLPLPSTATFPALPDTKQRQKSSRA
jgi:hypothetical protein